MSNYDTSTTEQRGWGMYFGEFLKGNFICSNHGAAGTDSRYCYQYAMPRFKNKILPGDYVIIQYAHNDMKHNGIDYDELYSFYIGQGMEEEAKSLKKFGTNPSTTYKSWLTKIIESCRELNANPIFVSSVCRANFSSDKITRKAKHDIGDSYSILTSEGIVSNQKISEDDHTMDYAYQLKSLAKELNVPFIDLTSASAELFEQYGSFKTHKYLNMPSDYTHFRQDGAYTIARLVARLMIEQGILENNLFVDSNIVDAVEACTLIDLAEEIVDKDFDIEIKTRLEDALETLKNQSPTYSNDSYQELKVQLELANKSIEEHNGNSDAIELIGCNDVFSVGIYTVNGSFIGNNIDYHSLPKGIYIVNGKLIMNKYH